MNIELRNLLFQYGVITLSLIVAGTVGFYLFFNPGAVKNNSAFYSFFMVVVVAVGFFICTLIFGNRSEMSNYPALISASFALVLLLGAVYLWHLNILQNLVTGRIINWLLGIAVVLFGLAFFYSFAKSTINSIQNEYSWTGFFARLIFFIPCMIYDLFLYLAEQIMATPNMVFIFFVAELLLITLYIASPYLINYFINIKSTFLLSDAVFLTKKNLLSDSTPMLIDNRDGEDNIRNNFSLSMWVYINDYNQTANRPAQTIFHYGDDTTSKAGGGHPHIDYQNRQLVFTFSNRHITSVTDNNSGFADEYRMDIEPQSWVFLVLNYKHNEVDLFVNAALKKTIRFSDNVPKYHVTDIVTVGDIQGVDGAICNVIYNPFPQTQADITSQYNLLMFSNPPVYSTFMMNRRGGIPREMVATFTQPQFLPEITEEAEATTESSPP